MRERQNNSSINMIWKDEKDQIWKAECAKRVMYSTVSRLWNFLGVFPSFTQWISQSAALTKCFSAVYSTVLTVIDSSGQKHYVFSPEYKTSPGRSVLTATYWLNFHLVSNKSSETARELVSIEIIPPSSTWNLLCITVSQIMIPFFARQSHVWTSASSKALSQGNTASNSREGVNLLSPLCSLSPTWNFLQALWWV